MPNDECRMSNEGRKGRDARSDGLPERTRYRFFLNPYPDMGFTKCPKCETKTRQRKVPLVIHIEPGYVFILNKTCRYCEPCDLLIGRQADIEALMAATFETRAPKIVGNKYEVIGTMDRQDWREGAQAATPPADILDRVYLFEDVWHFDVIPGGWYPATS